MSLHWWGDAPAVTPLPTVALCFECAQTVTVEDGRIKYHNLPGSRRGCDGYDKTVSENLASWGALESNFNA